MLIAMQGNKLFIVGYNLLPSCPGSLLAFFIWPTKALTSSTFSGFHNPAQSEIAWAVEKLYFFFFLLIKKLNTSTELMQIELGKNRESIDLSLLPRP